ncbi:MAG: hypothetical protein Q9157_002949 [Trypethelium eluteriae]
MPISIGLTQSNLDKGQDYLMDVSDPESINYGKHWTAQQITDAFAPSEETINAVKDWVVSSGISSSKLSLSGSKGWISMDITAGQAERLFHTNYHVYEHVATGQKTTACEQYHVPRSIQNHVDYVTPGVALASPARAQAKVAADTSSMSLADQFAFLGLGNRTLASVVNDLSVCDRLTTPACVKALYQIPNGTSAAPGNALGVFESNIGPMGSYNQNDLNQFFQTFMPNIPQGTAPTLQSINGGTAPSPPNMTSLEADLDFQVAYPIVFPQTTQVFQVNPGQFSPFNQFLDAIDATVVFASGDTGTGTPSRSPAEGCLTPQGVPGPGGNIFNVGSPVACPFVTTVGATQVNSGNSVNVPESAAVDPINAFSSGGGFSNVFATPQYQAKAVSNFIANGAKGLKSYSGNQALGANGGVFNASGRGYPDVSAAGKHFATFLQGQFAGTVDGTSAATPIFASVINRINDQRIAAGKSPVGFVNPALYANPGVLNDVTTGNNLGCANNTVGFTASTGWDPVTGLGTPNFPKMMNLFMGLP